MIKVLLVPLLFLQFSLVAQVKLEPAVPSIAKVLNEVGYMNMQAAWVIQGADTLYTFHFSGDSLFAKKSLFAADTLWLDQDSVYHKNQLFNGNVSFLAVYHNAKVKRQTLYENGKLTAANYRDHDSLGREIYHRQWHPSQVQTRMKHPNGMEEWWIEDVYSDVKTVRKQHADTNRVWSLLGKDTSSHRFTWSNYSEQMRSKPHYISKEWWDGVRRTRVVLADDFADSTILYEHDDEREMWQYQPDEEGGTFTLVAYNKVIGLKQPKNTYRYLPANDTARHTFETFAIVEGGHYRKTQELRLKKDSTRYRQIDYFWKPTGEIDHLEITNRWGLKHKVKPNWEAYQMPVGCSTGAIHPNREQPKPIDYRPEILSPDIRSIRVGDMRLDQLFYQKIEVEVLDPEQIAGKKWIEPVLFEIDEKGVLVNIYTSQNSVLDVSELKRAIGNSTLQMPGNTNTTLIYLDQKVKKHVAPQKFTLLAASVLVRER